MNINLKLLIGVCIGFSIQMTFAQQDPQFTQYVYNTLGVNPAYAGSRGHATALGLVRAQWVGLEGAPKTQTFTIDSPLGEHVGLGLAIVNDELGPSRETYIDLNFSYTIQTSQNRRLSFGIKGGGRFLDIDFTRGNAQSPDILFQNNVSEVLPTIGAGIYWHSDKNYIGISTPNLLTNQTYDDVQQTVAAERLHLFIIGGIVTDLSSDIKFKPAFLVKAVSGAPLIADLSANFMFYEKLRLGVSYRWDDSVSGLAGFQLTPQLLLGYSYDYTTTDLQRFNTGSHEIVLRFDLISNRKQLKSPRFF
ncbi:membrane protein [Dokdonia pacifica]|uniref:Type IX secretion system membrane protein, PorP/SprF family n=1 Tax=Dokdonia pacifica TaxID=1627892 RepID=A0A239AF49_9FLAO|nr:type IX secretion system membrane protein PorP/SprF [Dokdonia pacifica]GGG38162.1 membrane protein [Dokdonia pacifica]SNR93533.1 type IX secretion system membrane protein, PorP/SprF family [Dokdonia pacifica]